MASRVLPHPAAPHTRVGLPFGKPPPVAVGPDLKQT